MLLFRATRASPSGKARASQARIRGFESRRPLHNSQRCSQDTAAVFIWVPSKVTGLEPMRSKRVKKTALWAVFSVSGGALQRGAVVSRSETESRRPLHNSQRCSQERLQFSFGPQAKRRDSIPIAWPRDAECARSSSQHPSIVAAPFRKRFRPISQASTKQNRNAWGKQSSRLPLQKGRWFLCTTLVRQLS